MDDHLLWSGNISLLKYFVGSETHKNLLHEKILT